MVAGAIVAGVIAEGLGGKVSVAHAFGTEGTVPAAGTHVWLCGLKTNCEAAAAFGVFGILVGYGMAGSPLLQTTVGGDAGTLGGGEAAAAAAVVACG